MHIVPGEPQQRLLAAGRKAAAREELVKHIDTVVGMLLLSAAALDMAREDLRQELLNSIGRLTAAGDGVARADIERRLGFAEAQS
jgi:hypothetical protein